MQWRSPLVCSSLRSLVSAPCVGACACSQAARALYIQVGAGGGVGGGAGGGAGGAGASGAPSHIQQQLLRRRVVLE